MAENILCFKTRTCFTKGDHDDEGVRNVATRQLQVANCNSHFHCHLDTFTCFRGTLTSR